MNQFRRALCAFAVIGVFAPRAAHAAPVALQFDVTFDRLCDVNGCQTVSLGGHTLTLLFNDTVVESAGADLDILSSHATVFGPPSMSISGGTVMDLPNPFGSVTYDYSGSSLYFYEARQPAGYGATTFTSAVVQTHEGTTTNPDGSSRGEMWFYTLQLFQFSETLTGADGITTQPTGADFITAASSGTFEITWSAQIFTRDCPATGRCTPDWVADPRNFDAFGTATPLNTPPATVPEPTSLVLLGTGLLAIGTRLRQARRRFVEYGGRVRDSAGRLVRSRAGSSRLAVTRNAWPSPSGRFSAPASSSSSRGPRSRRPSPIT
jgi:hypothetical protein